MKKLITLAVVSFLLATTATAAQSTQWKHTQETTKYQTKQAAKQGSSEQRPAKQRSQTTPALLGDAVSYTTLNYSTLVPVGSTPSTGTVTAATENFTDPWSELASGKAFSFTAEAGKTYRISGTFTTTQSFNDYIGICVLENGPFTGSSDDVDDDISDDVNDQTTVTVSDLYVAPAAGNVRLLIYDNSSTDYSYSITIKEINPSPYTTLDYSATIPVGGAAVSGTMTEADNSIFNFFNDIVTGKGYSFAAEDGKIYKISCTFTSTTPMSDDLIIVLLENGVLQGDGNDILTDFSEDGYGTTQQTVTDYYEATSNAAVRLLLIYDDIDLASIGYSITIKEINPSSYTTLDYSTTIPVGGAAATGTMTEADNSIFDFYDNIVTGKGYSFAAEDGKIYKISCTFTSTAPMSNDLIIVLLQDGALQGDDNDILNYFEKDGDGTTQQTVTGYYRATSDMSVRLLLMYDDIDMVSIGYSITIEESDIPFYTEISYPALLVGSTPVTGTLSSPANNLINFDDDLANGTGYTFTVEAGKMYQITCRYYSPQGIYFRTGLYLLTGGTLEGNNNDVIDDNGYNDYNSECTITLTYTATAGGTVRILLLDYEENDLMYAIQVNETTQSATLTLSELLGNVTAANTITYTANTLQYTDAGMTNDLVQGEDGLNFRNTGSNYYAVAYKITLAAGDSINIHSAKEGDSYLYLYKADGSGGYTFIDYDDDGAQNNLESLLIHKATESGDYYIVVTDIRPDIKEHYYLTVWNTANEPANAYPELIAITALSAGNSSITVAPTATEEEIRLELMKLVITGTTADASVNIPNNPYRWQISGNTATYLPATAPIGYTLDAGLQPLSITINGITGTHDAQATPATIYAWDKNIVVKNAGTGSQLVVANITGKIIVRTILKDSETTIPVATTGIYIVRVGTQTAKVICR